MVDKEDSQFMINRSSTFRRLGIVVAGIGLGAVLAYLFTKAGRGTKVSSRWRELPDNPVDDRGTRQHEVALILRKLRDRAFQASDDRFAIALGRPAEDVAAWNAGEKVIDDDVVMKARGIAMNRGVRIE